MSEPQNPERSGFTLYGIGRVANNKALNAKEVEVTPVEQLSMLDGELVSLPFDSEVTGQNAEGSEYSAKVTLNTAITATWIALGSNRKTPPDVRRGERVFLYRYGDNDQFYWKETGWDDHLRRLETVHFRFSATADEAADMEDPANWYHLNISTHEGLIHLQTSKVNKEKAQYVLQINTKEGAVSLADDHGNFIELESVAKSIALQNGDGTKWHLDKEHLYGYARNSMDVVAEKLIHFKTTRFHLECETGHIDATSKFSIKTPTFEVESTTNMFKTPNSTFTGNVSINQNLTAAAGGSGMATFRGPCTFEQATTFNTRITANGIISSAPIQGPSDTI